MDGQEISPLIMHSKYLLKNYRETNNLLCNVSCKFVCYVYHLYTYLFLCKTTLGFIAHSLVSHHSRKLERLGLKLGIWKFIIGFYSK